MNLEVPIRESTVFDDADLEEAFEQGVRDILTNLESANLDYCILRNRDRIPAGLLEGSDVDILVHSESEADIVSSIMAGLQPLHIVQRREVVCAYYRIGDQILKIDYLYRNQEWLGAEYLNSREILDDIRDDCGIPVAAPWHEAFLCLFHGMLWGGTIKDRYVPVIQEATLVHPKEFGALLNRVFGRDLGSELFKKAAKGELVLSHQTVKHCRRALWTRAFRRKPLRTLYGLGDHFRQELALRFQCRPAGLGVAILGPDGSGKSSVCEALLNEPRTSLPNARRHRIHLFRRILPRPGDIRRGKLRPDNGPGDVVTDPHGQDPHSAFLSAVRMIYLVLSAWISELAWNRHQLAKNALILNDRHLIELSVDPARYRFGAPLWIARRIGGVAPKPDIIVLLDAPAAVLQARKQEVSYLETERQRLAYLELVQRMPNGFVVNADRPVEEIVADVRSLILKSLEDRTHTGLRLEGT